MEQKDKDNENRIKQLENENQLLKEKVKKLEEKPSNGVLDWSKLFDKKSNKSTEEIKLAQGIIELNKDASKRDNVIIIGIRNSNDPDPENRKKFDEDIVNDLFREINVNPSHVKRIHRFKSKEENSLSIQSSPLLIELPDSSIKVSVLKAAKQLKDSMCFKKVYINPDLNESERKLTKDLVLERNKLNEELQLEGKLNKPFRYGIRNNEIRKFRANQSIN